MNPLPDPQSESRSESGQKSEQKPESKLLIDTNPREYLVPTGFTTWKELERALAFCRLGLVSRKPEKPHQPETDTAKRESPRVTELQKQKPANRLLQLD